MTAIRTHRWGEARASERVWSQLAGLRPSLLASRWFVLLQAFMDESEGVGPDRYFTLAVLIASAEAWAGLSR